MTSGGFGFGLGAAGSEEVEGAVIGCCGGLKVGYLTEVSCRKVSISRGDDFIFSTDIIRWLAKIIRCIINYLTCVSCRRQPRELASKLFHTRQFSYASAAC